MDKDLAQHTKDSKIKEITNQTKTIGVVIPIYNVAPYLRECLDSVINQTYKNLSIVLVNDGSTDNNESLNIAKEYVSKDSRFILIDKENGGQSTARNTGIEWFKNKYQTKLDSTNIKSLNNKANTTNQNNKNTINDNSYNYGGGGQLLSYIITNDNPYNIYRIYTSNLTTNHTKDIQTNQSANITNTTKSTNTDKQSAQTKESQNNINNLTIESQSTKDMHQTKESLTPKHIDYIIFLDSDDYWKLNCIEECVKHSNGVDIVWFDYDIFYDGVEADSACTRLNTLNIAQQKISMKEWLYALFNNNQICFTWAWQGIIDFTFFKNIGLYFYDRVYAEDHLFGTLLFLQSKDIYIIREKLYIYRVRPNSSSDFDPASIYIPIHFQQFVSIFGDKKTTKQYYVDSSWFLMLIELIKFLESNHSKDRTIMEQVFLPLYIQYSMQLFDFKHDPLNLLPKIHIIEPYLKKGFKYRHKLRLTNPKKYNTLKPLFTIYDSIKLVEKYIRRIFKKSKNNKL